MLVWNNIESYVPDRSALTTWLTALTRNAALNRRRAGGTRQEDEPLDEAIADPAHTPEEALLQKERSLAIQRAVSQLPERDRALFYRKYYYYQSTAQMAAELGLSERAVEGRLYRLRKRLRKELGGERYD